MNVEQLEEGKRVENALKKNRTSIQNIAYFKKFPHLFYSEMRGKSFDGYDLKYLSDEELMDIINLIEKYLLAANQRLIDEFDEI